MYYWAGLGATAAGSTTAGAVERVQAPPQGPVVPAACTHAARGQRVCGAECSRGQGSGT